MNVLITGGAGFIGSNLAKKYIAEGHRVDIIDNLSTGRIDNLSDIIHSKNLKISIGDIRDVSLLESLFRECDVIFHLASFVGADLVEDWPIDTIRVNVFGTETILELARKYGRRVVYLSTSEIYGKGSKIPFNEEDDKIIGNSSDCRWSYGCSKFLDEILCFSYYKKYGVPITVIRPFNTIGNNQSGRYGMVVPRFIHQALSGEDITIYGDGTQTRCFAHVFDVVNGIAKLLDYKYSVGEVYNIGNDKEISIEDLAIKIKSIANSDSNIIKISCNSVFRKDSKERRVPDLTKIRKHIRYSPSISLDEAIEVMINYGKREKEK